MKPLALIIAGLILLGGFPKLPDGFRLPWPTTTVATPATPDAPGGTAAVYVYEKDEAGIPPEVSVGLDQLNRRGVVATLYENDTTDGTGDVPDQYRQAVEAARRGKLPALVVLSGSTVLRVLPSPTTAAAIVEAVP